MAILRAKEIRKTGKKDIESKVSELKKELMKLKSQKASGTMPENPGRIKEIRRTIARILTIEREVKTKI